MEVWCAACNATVIAQIDCDAAADANTVCVRCGMTLVDPPFEGGDYFDVIMRVRRPRPTTRARREQWYLTSTANLLTTRPVLSDPTLAARIASSRVRVADPCVAGKPLVRSAA